MKELYKLLALDVDGTLLNSRSQLTQETITAVRLAEEYGFKVTLVSGRRPRGMAHLAQELGLRLPLVGYNGGLVADSATLAPLRTVTIPQGYAAKVIRAWEEQDLCVFAYRSSSPPDVYHNGVAPTWLPMQEYIQHETVKGNMTTVHFLGKGLAFDPLRVMVAGSSEDCLKARQIAEPLLNTDLVKVFHTMNYDGTWYYELYPALASKSNGLRYLCEYFSIAPAEVVAVGDHVNDLDMIEFAGLGVAMGNAQAIVKENADLVIGHHDEHGLARFIRERLLAL